MSGEPVEENLRADLGRCDALAGSTQSTLRHLLGRDTGAIFGDDILARVRGMHAYLVRQLLGTGPTSDEGTEALSQALLQNDALLSHLHALALEWQLAERLEQQHAIDPVVPPLLQALIASPEPTTQDLAMKLLAAQARWCQGQRRMQLSLQELPGELFHQALLALRAVAGHGDAEANLRAGYDEALGRLGMAARLVTSMGSAASVALDLRHSGSTLFVTALALGSGQTREQAIVSTSEAQAVRLVLALRGAGLSASAVEQQLLMLHGEAHLPAGFDRVPAERAAAILAQAPDARR